MKKRFDVVAVGSTMLRLSVPAGERLETAPVYEVRTAGSESNAMAALARLGRRTAWVSRLVDNPLGRRVAGEISAHGVDVSGVIWSQAGRNEVFFVEYGSRPRPTQVVYDRQPSALTLIRFEELDLDLMLGGRILHLSGIFPALSPNCAQVADELIDRARAAGVEVSLDVNYRAKLWPPDEAQETLSPLLERADLIICTQEDAWDVFGLAGKDEEVAAALQERFKPRACVLTLGAAGALARVKGGSYRSRGYEVDVVDRLGAGDAFCAGFLNGWLDGSPQWGVEYGSAMAALKLGLAGDYFVSGPREVEDLLRSRGAREVGR